jgi:glutamine amidotransferase
MRDALLLAPRSLRALSTEHKHGWGVATHDRDRWSVAQGTPAAHADPTYDSACEAETHAWIAHVRLATVGSVQPENTHPFLRERWCFAHNGTIQDPDFLSQNVSPERDRERRGCTDSERFFAYILSRMDDAGLSRSAACARVDKTLADAVREATERERFGAVNFVLSDGETLYVHRLGRTLSVRQEADCFVAASEPWSDDGAWRSVEERTLLRVDLAAGAPRVRALPLD